ncbi:type III-B CRISPR module RAMP protein Cmr6 [Skermanella sp. TT6]|uniref:Type III-B CRISPR module RAMP protein Cmr6 n=1 Tax=Skermanella cutis TaxID=2775420 RepID=A0ABX7BDB2_9PROT|nr:type III-B CRISPR module RAMP protein Cmr6 [Skermanella sp. TT6]QQP92187.1 type III-B CRISPR module RAMP protein Cmr6 [Skermanella sp. TT6]
MPPELGSGPFVSLGLPALLSRIPAARCHPGLQLDKFSAGGTQKENQRPVLDLVCEADGDPALLATLRGRRRAMMLADLGAVITEVRTAGPLTLHLSRASALENAGICLHPLYGFVHLPGSGLKGMARAWAETVWMPSQGDAKAAQARIDQVFGTGPRKAGRRLAEEPEAEGQAEVEASVDGSGAVGSVVFHDAWPTVWPKLVRDIVTNHHDGYYQGKEPPGDWFEPKPVSFLSVPSGETFEIAVSPRAAGDAVLAEQAMQWLLAALCHRGAGAKTNAGYGAFRPVRGAVPAAPEAAGISRSFTLTLVAPGFFAGAAQGQADCELRPASLRGLLRWWWRTLFAGHLPLADLKELEALIWGDTRRAGAVRLTVEPTGQPAASIPYDKKRSSTGLTKPKDNKTVQGLWYASYGMDEPTGKPRQRYQSPPGNAWMVTLTARPTGKLGPAPADALDHAQAALWLLARYGGVGAKSRKGFGGFADIAVPGIGSVADCLALVRRSGAGEPRPVDAPDLHEASAAGLIAEWRLAKSDRWETVIDRAGTVLQQLAKDQVPKQKRIALGLPRNRIPFATRLKRHAAPYHLHFGRTVDGVPVLRFIGFPAERLPDRRNSTAMLKEFLARLDREFGEASGSGPGNAGPRRPAGPAAAEFPRRALLDGEPVTVLGRVGNDYRIRFSDGDTDFKPVSRVKLVD